MPGQADSGVLDPVRDLVHAQSCTRASAPVGDLASFWNPARSRATAPARPRNRNASGDRSTSRPGGTSKVSAVGPGGILDRRFEARLDKLLRHASADQEGALQQVCQKGIGATGDLLLCADRSRTVSKLFVSKRRAREHYPKLNRTVGLHVRVGMGQTDPPRPNRPRQSGYAESVTHGVKSGRPLGRQIYPPITDTRVSILNACGTLSGDRYAPTGKSYTRTS
jgi:hypothetical protein